MYNTIFKIGVVLLLVAWIPTLIDIAFNFPIFNAGISRQPFNDSIGNVIIHTLPGFILLTIVSLIWKRLRYFGLVLSTVLLAIISAYLGIALFGVWGELPCGCWSTLYNWSWLNIFLAHFFFVGISVFTLFLHRHLQRNIGSGITDVEGLTSAK